MLVELGVVEQRTEGAVGPLLRDRLSVIALAARAWPVPGRTGPVFTCTAQAFGMRGADGPEPHAMSASPALWYGWLGHMVFGLVVFAAG